LVIAILFVVAFVWSILRVFLVKFIKHRGIVRDADGNPIHFCDFCGIELRQGEYETFDDGREQCKACFSTAIDTRVEIEHFLDETKTIRKAMNSIFSAKIDIPVEIFFTNANMIASLKQTTYIPTPKFDSRYQAVAVKILSGHYFIYIEFGTPWLQAMVAAVHEYTHIWQYRNWKNVVLNLQLNKRQTLLMIEGMATWVEIQFLIFMKHEVYFNLAKQRAIMYLSMENEYGWGLYNFIKAYPFTKPGEPLQSTPFDIDHSNWIKSIDFQKPKATEMLEMYDSLSIFKTQEEND
jgi:hypothetical protein